MKMNKLWSGAHMWQADRGILEWWKIEVYRLISDQEKVVREYLEIGYWPKDIYGLN